MASTAADAPSTATGPLQFGGAGAFARGRDRIERWLEAERDQVPLWLPIALGGGIAAWLVLPDARAWIAASLAMVALALAGLAVGRGGRAGRAIAIGGFAAAFGLALIWWRAEHVAAPVLAHPVVATFDARVDAIETLAARDLLRMRLSPIGRPDLPPHFRVNLAIKDVPSGLAPGATIHLRGRLMPPPEAAVPGAYDYARVAWFDRIGATGRGFAPVTVTQAGTAPAATIRARLSAHVQHAVGGSAGAIAATLATGDRGAIAEDDAEAMRRAGLAHLLSISGLHVTAVVGAVMIVVLRLLALSSFLALRWRLPLIAALAGAAAAVGYTWLTGGQVPTIRSCVAALLVLAALALGREAITLRLVAAGAVVVLLLWPETLAGPSFQLSFAAVTAIVALHEHPRVRAWFARRGEGAGRRFARNLGSLLLTGLVVEIALSPIALYHFHKSGLYGALANIIAIPLTTFMVMPLEALALLLDTVGIGAPVWWLVGHALRLLLALAHMVADAPGSVAMLPAMPGGAFAFIILGGLWLALWRTGVRRLGWVPLVLGVAWALAVPRPDLLVTGDGRHVGLRTEDGAVAMLRERSGDYTKAMLSENGGVDGAPVALSTLPDARCSRDLCLAQRRAGGRTWRILATRSTYLVPIDALGLACAGADIVISERRLPTTCRPRWLKLDRPTLARTGGLAITLATGQIATVHMAGGAHPWRHPPTVAPPYIRNSGGAARRAFPGRGPDRERNAAGHRRGSPDRAGSSRPRAGNI